MSRNSISRRVFVRAAAATALAPYVTRANEDLSLAGSICNAFISNNNQRRIGPCQTI